MDKRFMEGGNNVKCPTSIKVTEFVINLEGIVWWAQNAIPDPEWVNAMGITDYYIIQEF